MGNSYFDLVSQFNLHQGYVYSMPLTTRNKEESSTKIQIIF